MPWQTSRQTSAQYIIQGSRLALLDVSGRVARTLLHLCQEPDAIALDKGVKIRITRQEIAKLIGCQEKWWTVLRELEANRPISVSGKTIVVFNKSRQRLLIMH